MSGVRANVGIGKLTRPPGLGPAELPYVGGGTSGTRLPIFRSDYTASTKEDCLHHLTQRVGAGIEISINRNRNNNYLTDIGNREFTTETSGNYEVSFSLSGAFVPEYSGWLEYGVLSQPILITSSSTFALAGGSATVGYVTTSGTTYTTPILEDDFNTYKATATATTGMNINVYTYVNLDGPRYFDLGYEIINSNTTFGGLNEYGVITGCMIDSFTITQESGSDAAVKFSIEGVALNEWISTTSYVFDYNAILSDVPTTVLATGCLSVDTDTGAGYVPIAQTDSMSVTLSNNSEKRGNCLKNYYSSFSIGTQTVELSTSTYSNNPNKYLSYMYGTTFADQAVSGVTIGNAYTTSKQPNAIPYMKFRSDDTSAGTAVATIFLDVDLTTVYVGSANRTLNVDSAIMDEPDLRARKIRFAVGYVPA